MTEHANCPHWGKGGRYTVVDGKRVPVSPTPPVPQPQESRPIEGDGESKPKKGG